MIDIKNTAAYNIDKPYSVETQELAKAILIARASKEDDFFDTFTDKKIKACYNVADIFLKANN